MLKEGPMMKLHILVQKKLFKFHALYWIKITNLMPIISYFVLSYFQRVISTKHIPGF